MNVLFQILYFYAVLKFPFGHFLGFVMKSKDLQPRLHYPAKLSFRMEGQIKYFPDKVKLKDFVPTKPLLYEMLKGLI